MRITAGRAVFYVTIVVVCAVAFFPFYWLINTSLITSAELFSFPPRFLPSQGLLGTYSTYIRMNPILVWLRNSFFVSFSATVVSTVFAVLGSYSISRFRYKGRTAFVFLILFTQMLPHVLLVIPIYVLFLGFHLNNTLVGLAMIYTVITVPIGLWFLKGFFDSIPLELEQAAQIDGCSRMGTLFRVTLPLCVPGVIATATWSFIVAWDELVFAYTFISAEKLWPVAVGLSSHIGQYSVNWSEIMAGAVMATIPVGILFIFFQRYLVSGITAGSVKG
jgi:multiple sugar transport system permease protein